MPLFPNKPEPRGVYGTPSVVHRAVQYMFMVFFLYVGLRFYWYFLWATGQSELYVAKPASVEAFLPLSALLAFKRLVLTGQYDFIHPAGLTILLMAFFSAFLFRKGFCGYLCPVGGATALFARMGTRFGVSWRPGTWLSVLLTLPKYYLLYLLVNSMLIHMDAESIGSFLRSPYNMVADSKMMLFFVDMGLATGIGLAVLCAGSIVIPGLWCRGFCPYGALLGLFSMVSPVAVRRDAERCTGCRRCANVCPSRIAVHEKKRISGPECVGCVECIGACPVTDCLTLRGGYGRRAHKLPHWTAALGAVAVVVVCYGWAELTGHWESSLPGSMFRKFHEMLSLGG